MKISQTILSIPPYISTTWQQIAALHVHQEENSALLVIDLINGTHIEIPHLDDQTLAIIFHAHAAFLENGGEDRKKMTPGLSSLLSLHLPAKLLGEGMDKVAGILQHNPDAAHTDDLPQEFLDKIASVTKSLNIEDTSNTPTPIAGCNCLFCQIARTIQAQITDLVDPAQADLQLEEEVKDEDLRFKTWDIHQRDHQLYEVVNPLDKNEHYNVFLGHPLGCTCGLPHCEHIRAVLRS